MKIYKISDDCRAWMDNALVYIKTYSSSANYPKANIMLDMEELKAIYELVFQQKEEEMEEEPVEERCDVCVFWLRYSKTEHGPCRRYPPTSISSLTMTHQKTASDNWCGEFQPK